MSFKDKERQNNFQNKWLSDRRRKWIEENGPCKKCGSSEQLVVSKNDPEIESVKVFSYSEAYRNQVLAKCQVLCRKCLIEKNSKRFSEKYKGQRGDAKKLTPIMVWSIRGRLMGKESIRKIASEFNLTHKTICEIKNGTCWNWLKPGRRKIYGINKDKSETKEKKV